jgi:chromosome segregation ATPase
MDEKIAKLRAATDEASTQLGISRQALEAAEAALAKAKDKYRTLSVQLKESGDELMVNDTELPELIETQIRAKNVYETVEKRYNTNKRYLELMIRKQDGSGDSTTK